jgi:HAD superfamily hydrolase (TIGR01509 family)
MIKAIILDMDGTLVDTSKTGVEVFASFLKRHNLECSPEKVMEIRFRSIQHVLKEVMEINNKEYSDELYEELREQYHAGIRKELLMPGAIPFLESIHEKVIMILATFSSNRSVEAVLSHNDIAKYFDMIVTRETYNDSKKADMIKKILEKTKLKPEECLLVEDSHYGIESGKVNGVFTIGVRHTFPDIDADENVDNLSQAGEIITTKLKSDNSKNMIDRR